MPLAFAIALDDVLYPRADAGGQLDSLEIAGNFVQILRPYPCVLQQHRHVVRKHIHVTAWRRTALIIDGSRPHRIFAMRRKTHVDDMIGALVEATAVGQKMQRLSMRVTPFAHGFDMLQITVEIAMQIETVELIRHGLHLRNRADLHRHG